MGRHYRQKEQQVLRPRGPEQPETLEELSGVQSAGGRGAGERSLENSHADHKGL